MNGLDFLKYYGIVRDLLLWVIRRLRGEPSRPAPASKDLLRRELAWDEVRHGFRVPSGWRCALLHAGIVQQELEQGRYGRRAVARIAQRKGLGSESSAVFYRSEEFPLNFSVAPLFTSDHHELALQVHAHFRLKPTAVAQRSEVLPQLQMWLSESLRPRVQQWISNLDGETVIRSRGMEAECPQRAAVWIEESLQKSVLILVRITHARVFNEFLSKTYRQYEEMAEERAKLGVRIEQNRLKGAWRQAILEGKLREIQDEDRFEETVRALQQDRALKERLLRMELEQGEIDELHNKIEIARRKYLILQQALEQAAGSLQSADRLAARLREALEHSAFGSADSPFSPQEREQIRSILNSLQQQPQVPEEILSSITRDGGIRFSLFDPFAGLRGAHTVKVGDGWRAFDGESLWQVRLTGIRTRRHGFLWLKESPAQAFFEVRGSPGNRRLVQEVHPGVPLSLRLGSHDLTVELLGGSAAQITLRIP